MSDIQLPQPHGKGSHPHPHTDAGAYNHSALAHAEHNIQDILHKNPHDFAHVYKELNQLRRSDSKHFQSDLEAINKDLHKKGYLPHLHLVQDDRPGAAGFGVVSDDSTLKGQPGNHTMVSTSHRAPRESSALRQAYHSMHDRSGHHTPYQGWGDSVEGGGGAHGGFDKGAVGGHVPTGARKELIDKALELAGLPVNEEYEKAVNKIVTRESGWNPNITNNWDSNARAGHPSTGLMQTIPSTFKEYALKGLDTNIHDPLSNLVAGIRYAQNDPKYRHRGGLLFVASRSGGY